MKPLVQTDAITAIRLSPADNVAVLLSSYATGVVRVVDGEATYPIEPAEAIDAGHKIAVVAIAVGASVVKHGVAIGVATQDIAKGHWVHVHNLRSAFLPEANDAT